MKTHKISQEEMDALTKCINERWKPIYLSELPQSADCALCVLHGLYTYNSCDCNKCIIYTDTGARECEATPYYDKNRNDKMYPFLEELKSRCRVET